MRRAALFLALLCIPVVARGQSPLDRRVTVHARDIPLRDALDRIALAAGVRLAYSSDNLPLDRRVSVSVDTMLLGDALEELLRGYPVRVLALARDHVVLAPRQTAEAEAAAAPIPVLEGVLVKSSVLGATTRHVPVAIEVVPGREIERRDQDDLSQVLSGTVPGVWVWERSPASMLAGYGSIRGASSFGVSVPKIYVDGIEVANPLLLTELNPELVERVEIIRGPQGAALYGSDAISGVVNVVSRHEGAGTDGSHATLRSSAGSARAFDGGTVPVQEHALTLRLGSSTRSAGLTVGAATSGDYVPGAASRELRGQVETRVVGARSVVTAHGRFFAKSAGVPASPLLEYAPQRAAPGPQQLRMYAGGSTLTFAADNRWTYALTAGVDGYTLSNVASDLAPMLSVSDTALRDASGSALRASVRGSATSEFGAAERAGATLTFAFEHSVLHDQTLGATQAIIAARNGTLVSGWGNNTGVSAQAKIALLNRVYLTAGARHERIGQGTAVPQDATLPALGLAWVLDGRIATLKLRGAYGRGIRAARSTMLVGRDVTGRIPRNPNMAPEQQSGVEGGADVMFGRELAFHVTRFDQLASGLMQTVTVTDPAAELWGRQTTWLQLQNVGQISNRGWEAQATLALGRLDVKSAATLVDSRVRRLAEGYTGDLRAGDRMLAVPARTLSGTASWQGTRYQISSTISRASNWINYDQVAIASAEKDAGIGVPPIAGEELRRFWTTYPGATRLLASGSFDVRSSLTLTVAGMNLLDHQRGEPDTMSIVPGRTIAAGVRLKF